MVAGDAAESCPLGLNAGDEDFAEMQLKCLFCGAPARLEGR